MPIIEAIPQGFRKGLYKPMTSRPAHFKRLLKFLRRKGRSREDAEDLIQEAMLRLHLYSQAVPVMNEEAFLRHAVNNLAIDQHRRDRLDLCKEVPIEELNARSPLIAPESTPEDTLEAQQRLSGIRAALDAVSLRTREICSIISIAATPATSLRIISGIDRYMIHARKGTRCGSRASWIKPLHLPLWTSRCHLARQR
jgi:RNA polymerase sigma-70 factor (ECF subfamily)